MPRFCDIHQAPHTDEGCPYCARDGRGALSAVPPQPPEGAATLSHADADHFQGASAADEPHAFDSGAVRSERKPYYSAIPAASLRRLALRATGAPKGETYRDEQSGFTYSGGSRGYGYGNWMRGLPMEDTFNHIIEHLNMWRNAVTRGETPADDDLAAAAWGIMFPLMTFEGDYREQHQYRATLWHDKISPEQIDKQMMEFTSHRYGYLLQPLAPERSASARRIGIRGGERARPTELGGSFCECAHPRETPGDRVVIQSRSAWTASKSCPRCFGRGIL